MKKEEKIARANKRFADRLENPIRDEGDDGWWGDLKDGWQRCPHSHEHSCSEETLDQLIKALGQAVFCDCQECKDSKNKVVREEICRNQNYRKERS